MKKKKKRISRSSPYINSPISWLPIDSRLILPIFSFGHVKGIAKLFLEAEIFLAILIVVGTMVILVLRLLS